MIAPTEPRRRRSQAVKRPTRRSQRLILARGNHKLPVELHATVLHFVALQYHRPTWLACARTCREWLRIMAPCLFSTIYLHNAEKIEKLLNLQNKYDSSFVFRYVCCIYVRLAPEPSTGVGPVPLLDLLTRHFPLLKEIHSGPYWHPLGSQEKECSSSPEMHRSVHQSSATAKGCYKQFAHLSALTTLSLANYEFHSFTDIIRVCGSLHALESLNLQLIVWKHTPRTIPPLRHFTHRLRRVSSDRCTSAWPLLWLWACYSDNADRSPSVHLKDLSLAGTIAKIFDEKEPYERRFVVERSSTHGAHDMQLTLDSEDEHESHLHLQYVFASGLSHPNCPGQITQAAIGSHDEPVHGPIRWPDADRALLGLSCLSTVTIHIQQDLLPGEIPPNKSKYLPEVEKTGVAVGIQIHSTSAVDQLDLLLLSKPRLGEKHEETRLVESIEGRKWSVKVYVRGRLSGKGVDNRMNNARETAHYKAFLELSNRTGQVMR